MIASINLPRPPGGELAVPSGQLKLQAIRRNHGREVAIVWCKCGTLQCRFEIDGSCLQSFAKFQAAAFKAAGVWLMLDDVTEDRRNGASLWRTLVEVAFGNGWTDEEPSEPANPPVQRKLIGVCGVDSGSLVIADPAYLGEHVTADGCIDGGMPPRQLKFDNGLAGAGVFVGTEYGDGSYGVYAVRDEYGSLLRVEIDLTDGCVPRDAALWQEAAQS